MLDLDHQIREGGGGGGGHPDPGRGGGGAASKKYFWALRASFSSKNKVGGGGGLPWILHCFSCYLKLGTAGVGNACITLRFHPWREGFRSLIKQTEYQHQLQNENKDIHCDALKEARFSD